MEDEIISTLLLPRLFTSHCGLLREAWLYLTPDQRKKIKDTHVSVEKYWGEGDYYHVCHICDEQTDMHPCSVVSIMEAFE
ncbi:hypothetical protein LCGC14_2720290 [marine sediment metagenome]|uniref:Uncharacterized protein n=1 Tax=marine sediment metagenome TaxID=412755 RepID=A0A0F8ZA70_9ZZZZ